MVNRSATWADWDEELLAIELLDLQTADFDLALTGFDAKEIDELLLTDAPDEDADPAAAEPPGYPCRRPVALWAAPGAMRRRDRCRRWCRGCSVTTSRS